MEAPFVERLKYLSNISGETTASGSSGGIAVLTSLVTAGIGGGGPAGGFPVFGAVAVSFPGRTVAGSVFTVGMVPARTAGRCGGRKRNGTGPSTAK